MEARRVHEQIEIHDSKDPRCVLAPGQEPIIAVPIPAWDTFLVALTVAPWTATTEALVVIADGKGGVALRHTSTGTTLLFNQAEWEAFLAGVGEGEFATELARS